MSIIKARFRKALKNHPFCLYLSCLKKKFFSFLLSKKYPNCHDKFLNFRECLMPHFFEKNWLRVWNNKKRVNVNIWPKHWWYFSQKKKTLSFMKIYHASPSFSTESQNWLMNNLCLPIGDSFFSHIFEGRLIFVFLNRNKIGTYSFAHFHYHKKAMRMLSLHSQK